jgi:acid phosphatase type 7
VLYEADTDVVFSGHEHTYERFSPQGRADPEGGIRQFVVGTGGVLPYP